jgi:phenylacetate-coenzyme A ligase PaaK-like adenylate-forming protein
MAGIPGLIRAAPRYALMLRSQYWAPEKLRRYVEANLARSFAAAMHIPFYRRRLNGVTPQPGDLQSLPILPRAQILTLFDSVRSLHTSETNLVASGRTSGSTGMPVGFFYDARHQASRFAARARYLRENGWSPILRSAWFMSTRTESTDAWFVRHGRLFGARFAHHIGDLEQQAEWLRKQDPAYLYAFPVNLDGLARVFEARRWRLNSLRRIFSGSEVLEDSLRERLRRVFGVEVSDNYGSTEAFLAWQCPDGSYHVNAEHVLLEIVDECGRSAAPGTMGRVLVTTLQNHLMPLIRYEIGDYAIAVEGSCRCGRTLPLIGHVLGREINLFIDGRGKRFVPWPLFRPLTAREWITQYQVVQSGLGRFAVRFVSDRDLSTQDQAEIGKHFEEITRAPATIEFQRLEQIPRAPSGKFMMAMSEMTLEP